MQTLTTSYEHSGAAATFVHPNRNVSGGGGEGVGVSSTWRSTACAGRGSGAGEAVSGGWRAVSPAQVTMGGW